MPRRDALGIVRWARQVGVGGQIGYTVDVLHSTGGTTTAQFIGTAYGTPGPVLMRLLATGAEVWVDTPDRFGDRFGREWVRRFYGLPATQGAR